MVDKSSCLPKLKSIIIVYYIRTSSCGSLSWRITIPFIAYEALSHAFNSPVLTITNPLHVLALNHYKPITCINNTMHELLMHRFLTAFMHFGVVTPQDAINSYVHIELNKIVWRQDDVSLYQMSCLLNISRPLDKNA